MRKSFMSKKGQKGFTLLELLVVITLLAILSVGALVAYEGIGDNAQATAASNNTATADQAIRNFRAVTQEYPDQWDNLVDSTGAALEFAEDETNETLMSWTLPASGTPFRTTLNATLAEVGITTLQTRVSAGLTLGVEPNLQHNEGAVENAVEETAFIDEAFVSILPTFGGAACSADGAALPTTNLAGGGVTEAGERQNVINDSLEDDECNLVLAVGFGHDAAHSTNNSNVAISTAPTYVSKDINPANSYARYIALFHIGRDTGGGVGGAADNNIAADELFEKARLLAVLDTEGHVIDENIADQNPEAEDND